ncbi:hypothetical protein [Nocardia sp. NPDC047038]|uniref:hypothetical protein n=1 Tax=Nocardia sp. NPDC047038 TaxID=3154338 RepID=UPI0033F99D00
MTSPRPDEPDVHLSMSLRGIRFDFRACVTAALLFIQDNQQRRYIEDVRIIPGDAGAALRRMANERLYLEP